MDLLVRSSALASASSSILKKFTNSRARTRADRGDEHRAYEGATHAPGARRSDVRGRAARPSHLSTADQVAPRLGLAAESGARVSAASKVLDRLERVKQTGAGRWAAACPCCQSRRGRPVSVREIDDRVLMHPFCGCSTEAVLAALDLMLADLYDAPLGQQLAPSHSRIPARDLLELISHEVTVSTLLLGDVLERQRPLDESGWKRLAQAAARIGQARVHAYGR